MFWLSQISTILIDFEMSSGIALASVKSITIKAPAKVNLILEVLGRRPNGYHDLFMVMEKLSLSDEIYLEEIPSGFELSIEGEADRGMESEKNLAIRAARAFCEFSQEKQGVRIHLKKQIPIAAGLGGGSSDAAAVLKGLNELWQKGYDSNLLAQMGSRLGGDVPFFCFDGAAIAEGIGDRITPIPQLPTLFFLLINPSIAISTPWVYEEYDRRVWSQVSGLRSQVSNNGSFELTQRYKDASNSALTHQNIKGGLFKSCSEVALSLKNDLEKVTITAYPEIQEIKNFLLNHGAVGSLMSGSGPTVFGIFADANARQQAFANVAKQNWKVFAVDNLVISDS